MNTSSLFNHIMSFNIKILWRWWGNCNVAALRVPGVSVQHDLQYTVEWFRLEGIHGGHLVQHTDSRANFKAGSGCSGSSGFSICLRMKMSQSLCKSFEQSHLNKSLLSIPFLLLQTVISKTSVISKTKCVRLKHIANMGNKDTLSVNLFE